MYEDQTFENITARMLGRASPEFDKREGSILYDAAAMVAPEFVNLYMELDYYDQRTDPDQAEGADLDLKVKEKGITREPATVAVRLGFFADKDGNPFDVPIGSRFSADDVNFVVTEKYADGQFYMECETAGRIGNEYVGILFPIEYIEGLVTAELKDIIIPGEDQESDASLRERYNAALQTEAFGGNEADYREKVGKLPGVGGMKIYRAWDGGGTVKIVFINSEFAVPTSELVDDVQTAVDPVTNSGEGLGIAPIGHRVTVVPVTGVTIDVTATVTYAEGWSGDTALTYIKETLAAYYREINETWEDNNNLVVRISYIESRLLELDFVVDIADTAINGTAKNLTLGADDIAVEGGFNGS